MKLYQTRRLLEHVDDETEIVNGRYRPVSLIVENAIKLPDGRLVVDKGDEVVGLVGKRVKVIVVE